MKQYFNNLLDGTDSRWQLAGWLLLLAFPVTALVVNKAASTIFTLFAFAGLWLLITGKYERPERELRWVMIAFASYFLVGLASYLLGEQSELGWKILGRDVRFLVVLPIVFSLVAIRVDKFSLAAAISFSGIVAGVVAIVQVLISDAYSPRASGETISILFGHLCAALFLATLMISIISRGHARLLSIFGSLGSLAAVSLSQSRGAIIAGAVVIVISLVAMGFVQFRKSERVSLFTLSAAALLLVTIIVSALASNRLLNSGNEIATALTTLNTSPDKYVIPELPACRNDRTFLERLERNSLYAGSFNLDVQIVEFEKGDESNAYVDCPDQLALRIRNPDTQRNSWLYMPERSIPPSAKGEARLIIQGQGKFGIGGGNDPALKVIDNNRAELVRLGGYSVVNNQILIILGPGQQALVWPVVSFPGEYEFLATNSSAGLRLELWKSAIRAFREAPITGIGVGQLPGWTASEASKGMTPWSNAEFDHAHNDILNTAAERGILGLLSLFAVYAAPFWLFLRRRDVFGYAGMAFVASIFLSGLTETIFNHSLGITYYSMMVLILATAPRADADGMTENTQTSRKS